MPLKVIPLDALPRDVQSAIALHEDRALCPACKGGTSREHSLSIRPDTERMVTSLWCYRSTCGFKALTVMDERADVTRRKVKEARVYDTPTIPLQGEPLSRLIADYGLSKGQMMAHGWRLSEDGNWIVMPVRDPYGLDRGLITRTVYETPKRVYTYKQTSLPFLDYWLHDSNAPVVVVEDTLSACRLSGLGYSSIALLGTGISREDAREIASVTKGLDRILSLDRDAFDKAMKLRDRHAHVCRFHRVLCLDEDIKNMEDDNDIRGLIDGRYTTSSGHLQGQKSL